MAMISPPQYPRDDDLVSVIIPCYKQAHFLGEAIESVLAQTHPHHEVIVIDDGSPDDTKEVVARYPSVRYAYQSNGGLSAARNAGLRKSRGKFVVFLDADDRLLPHALRSCLDSFRDRPECAMVSGHYRLMRVDGTPGEDFEQTPLEADPYLTLLDRNYIGMNATVMHRRATIEAVGGFDTSLVSCEDYELYLRIARHYPVHTFNQVVAEYRRYDDCMTMDPARMMKGVLVLFQRLWPQVRGNVEYMRAYRAGIRRNVKAAYWPLLGNIRRNLRAGHLQRAFSLSLRLLKYPTLLPRALWLERNVRIRLALADRRSPPSA
jgi:glycosyltransferase involved in cell wall biosynthesis